MVLLLGSYRHSPVFRSGFMRSLQLLAAKEGRKSNKLSERSNEDWMAALRGPEKNVALEELRLVLVRGLTFGLQGTLGRKGALDHVEDFAQDALLRILQNLDSFRGESRFTTWAQKIALRVAFSELRRKRWENVSLDQMIASSDPKDRLPVTIPDGSPNPEELTSGQLGIELVTEIIETSLTELQRTALKALILQEMPMEEVARKLNTNRNALYKLLHDARKKVKTELTLRGITPEEILSGL